jgi:hypothetical protein
MFELSGTLWNFMELYGTFRALGKTWAADLVGCCVVLGFVFWRRLQPDFAPRP